MKTTAAPAKDLKSTLKGQSKNSLIRIIIGMFSESMSLHKKVIELEKKIAEQPNPKES